MLNCLSSVAGQSRVRDGDVEAEADRAVLRGLVRQGLDVLAVGRCNYLLKVGWVAKELTPITAQNRDDGLDEVLWSPQAQSKFCKRDLPYQT